MRAFILTILLLVHMPIPFAPGQRQGVLTVQGEDITPEEEEAVDGILSRDVC